MLSLPNPPKVIKKEGNKAVFELEALYPGYGVTIGNSLRRVLLSSLEGAAVTQVKIKGVSHEFSTIPGVLEDVITIMMNLKQLRFKLLVPETQKATLKIKGIKEVKGADFSLPSQVELINKNCHVATLTSKSADLEIEIQIEKGAGYSARDSRKKEKLEIGSIAVDAIFSPIKRISYKVENMRVGERTDFDRLFLEVETDGTIAPEEAVLQSCDTLIKHFVLFSEALKMKTVVADEKKPTVKKVSAVKKAVAKKKVATKTSKKTKK
jgi:DNA-directed RNA polymerase subunit alpha